MCYLIRDIKTTYKLDDITVYMLALMFAYFHVFPILTDSFWQGFCEKIIIVYNVIC